MNAAALFALIAAMVTSEWAAQRPQTADLGKPAVPMVLVVGCVGRDSDGSSLLTHASRPIVSSILHADAKEIEQASKMALGTGQYRLIGAADFDSVEKLLTQGQRTQYTRADTANATGQLRVGHKVAVKALLITTSREKRLNLLSVTSVASSCS